MSYLNSSPLGIMSRLSYILYLLLYYSAFVLIFRSSADNYHTYIVNENFKSRSLTLCNRINITTSIVPSIAESSKTIQIPAIPTKMDTDTGIVYNETGVIKEYGLLMNVVPSSILFDIPLNFQLGSPCVILTKRISEEDLWYKTAFTYQREAWFD